MTTQMRKIKSNHFVYQKSPLNMSSMIIMALLAIRIPFAAGIRLFSNAIWHDPAYQISTYLLTAWFIYLERDKLSDYHIDKLVIIIIIFFKPIQTLILDIWGYSELPLAFPK
jgi:hypothetical protein